MKKLLLSCFIISTFMCSHAQITLDTTIYTNVYFGYDFKPVQISANETKWFFADTLHNTFSLYNMDFTPFLTNIAVPEPFAPSSNAMEVLYISRTLFDCDSTNIEYAFYSPQGSSGRFKIMRSDGTLLLQRDSVSAFYCFGCLGGTEDIRPIVNTSSGAKLFLQPMHGISPTYIYSLCGSLPVDVFDFKPQGLSYIKVYPNPASQAINFKITLPDNTGTYDLVIIDANGSELKRDRISSLYSVLSIDVSNYGSGNYYYSLSTKNKSYQSGKFIITK